MSIIERELIMSEKIKKTVKILGNLITLLAIYFVFKKLFSNDVDYHLLFQKKNILPAFIIVLVQAIIVVTNCLPWKKLVALFTNKSISLQETIPVYVKSNLLKYLPGNVFQYVGRNELAVKKKLPHLEVAGATIIDVLMNVVSAFLISIVVLYRFIWTYIQQNIQLLQLFLIVLLIIVGIISILLFVTRHKLKSWLYPYAYIFQWKNIATIAFCLFYYIAVMLISSLMYMLCLTLILDVPLSTGLFLQLFSAYTLAWLVGFITPGAPAGIGIKEAVMVAVTGGLVNVQIISLSMVTFRIFSTLSDILAFVVVALLKRKVTIPEDV